MVEKKSPKPKKIMDSKQEIESNLRQIRKSSIILIVLVVALSILFIGLSVSDIFTPKQKLSTFEQLYQDTLNGKESEKNFLYNGYVFVNDGTFWVVRVAKGVQGTAFYSEFNVPFYYSPRQVQNISYEKGSRNLLLAKQKVYLTQDQGQPAELTIAAIEVGRIIGNKYGLLGKETKGAVTSEPPEGEHAITCANVTRTDGVVHFRIANQTRVYSENGCLIVEGTSPREVIRASDMLAYYMLNILQDYSEYNPQEGVLGSQQLGNYTVTVRRLSLAKGLSADVGQGFIAKDTADGIFYVPLVEVTNSANQSLVFSPGAFRLVAGNATYVVDYKKQRFLDGKLSYDNTIPANESKLFQVAYDVPELYEEVTLVVDFIGVGEATFDLPVQLPQ